MKQNDQQTFTKLFNHCCLPVLGTNRTVNFLNNIFSYLNIIN